MIFISVVKEKLDKDHLENDEIVHFDLARSHVRPYVSEILVDIFSDDLRRFPRQNLI